MGRKKTFPWRYHRRPQTTQERKENESALLDGIHIRGARHPRHIPNAWDDLQYSRNYYKPVAKKVGQTKADKRRGWIDKRYSG